MRTMTIAMRPALSSAGRPFRPAFSPGPRPPGPFPGNTALAIDPDADYAVVQDKAEGAIPERLIMAEALIAKLLSKGLRDPRDGEGLRPGGDRIQGPLQPGGLPSPGHREVRRGPGAEGRQLHAGADGDVPRCRRGLREPGRGDGGGAYSAGLRRG